MKPSDYDDKARWFAAQGFVVVVPMRRGYGRSDGPYTEGSGTCEKPALVDSGLTMANDIRGVLLHMAKEPYVDDTRIIIVGQSAGGLASLAVASRNPPGVVGVINFAGGRRNRTASGGGYCSFDPLIEAAGRFGTTARVPALWIYTENDSYFDASVSKPMSEAYRKGGAPLEYLLLPAFGKDGHALFHEMAGQRVWVPLVTEFLRAQKLMK
jgi:dienelactone hydrolase